ncbi:MAG TPA: GNAT family N-acetyltransferase [Microvirga sp.]|jgi:RimJ/RimL family protein N-acetyltransferase|nr:GNAT family N-acetyltransferase [Microvirga sp.]
MSQRIHLRPLGPELARRIAEGEPQDEVAPDQVTPVLREVAVAHHGLFRRTGAREPWIAYIATERSGREAAVVGTCAFKDAPRDGRVEIAYFTFPGHEGRGIGRTMAAALVEIARSQGSVVEVVAHTLPQASASTRILERLGFAHTGTVVDPEDGPVWRWLHPL